MLKADLHIHTEYSMDCYMTLDQVIGRCLEKKINCVAIADHGTIEGALKMQRLAPFKVIVAEEILTPHGEIMGMFLQETVPSGQSVAKVLAAIKAQGGLVCIPHPYDNLRPSALGGKILAEIVDHVDLVEAFNSRDVLKRHSAQTKNFARQHDIPVSAGSDAHSLYEIGNAYVEMPEFDNTDEFLQSLNEGKIVGHRSNPLHRFNGLSKRLRSHFR
ncbi:PHP-associated domain-containing protein [Chloroflexota bacterium]